MKNKIYNNEEDIKLWLDTYRVINYKLIKNENYGYVVNVNGKVDLYDLKLDYIPVKFNIINGDFYCSKNLLSNLEFAPEEVNGCFDISFNQINSLELFPKKINGDIIISDNSLKSLKGSPLVVNGSFYCGNNELTSLEGCPKEINGDFWCMNNKLESLKGCPEKIKFHFLFVKNPIKKIEEIPIEGNIIQGDNIFSYSQLKEEYIKEKIINLHYKLDDDILIKSKENKINKI